MVVLSLSIHAAWTVVWRRRILDALGIVVQGHNSSVRRLSYLLLELQMKIGGAGSGSVGRVMNAPIVVQIH